MRPLLLTPMLWMACRPPDDPAIPDSSGTADTDASDPAETGDTAAVTGDSGEVCAEGISLGACAPDFTLQDQHEAAFTLSSYDDRVVVMSLFTGW